MFFFGWNFLVLELQASRGCCSPKGITYIIYTLIHGRNPIPCRTTYIEYRPRENIHPFFQQHHLIPLVFIAFFSFIVPRHWSCWVPLGELEQFYEGFLWCYGAPLVSTRRREEPPPGSSINPFVHDVVQVPRRRGAGPRSNGPDPPAKGWQTSKRETKGIDDAFFSFGVVAPDTGKCCLWRDEGKSLRLGHQ